MWRLPLILNTLLMLLLGFCSAMSTVLLHNRYVQYPESDARPLPMISTFALGNSWLYYAIPGLWTLLLIAFLAVFWRKEPPSVYIQSHTSATLLVGFAMLAAFLLAGILPFLSVTMSLSN